ncbi:hypothetical protein AAKU52_001408 [Pedobacter sp. CG_S7]|uniref:hypothetical protein n=1 Tax=Pedobacter sp. CG_S7 TaxID=3143930 RepID=UPI003392C154
MMDKELFCLLTTRYLSGECTGEENDQLNAYLATDEYLDLFLKLSEAWNQEEKNTAQHHYDNIRGLDLLGKGIAKKSFKKPFYALIEMRRYLAYAALLAGILLTTALLFHNLNRQEPLRSITAPVI